MDVLYQLFTDRVEKILDKSQNLHLMDKKEGNNFRFVDINYQSKERSVIIKEAELSESTKMVYYEMLEILLRIFERELNIMDTNIKTELEN